MRLTSGVNSKAVAKGDEASRVAQSPGEELAPHTIRHTSPVDIGDAQREFRDAAAARGLVLPLRLVSGRLQRCGTDDDENGTDGTYLFYEDGLPAGGFQNHKDGVGWENWHAKPRNGHPFAKAERRQIAERHRKVAEQAERDKAARVKEAAGRSGKIWSMVVPASDDHPYLRAKGVKAHDMREMCASDLVKALGYVPKASGHELTGRVLVIPMRDADNALWSLQFIDDHGCKANLAGGRKQGCFAVIGRIDPQGNLLVGEGPATMASCHEATGLPAVIAFDCENLRPVAKALQAKYPNIRMTFCADHDAWTKGNPGASKAHNVVAAVGGWLAVPQFSALRAEGETDFNDLHRNEGVQAVRRCIEAATPSTSDKRPVLVSRRASDITPEPITWLWPGRIARGKVTLIAGMPGLGKSQVTAYLAATVSIGGILPADGGKSPLGSVIFLSAEDDPADTIVPRLMAAGADRTRIEIVEAVSEPAPGQPGIRRPVSLKSDLVLLSEIIARLGDTALVIVDPISAYLGNVDSHKNAEVRALLAPLTDWAAQRQVAVVGVTHLNKGGGDALSRFTGSMAFVAAARGGFLVVPDAEDDTGERRLFLPAKNNIARKLPGLAFTVQGVILPNEIETSRIEWCPGEVNVSADQALYGANDSDETHASGAIAEAVDWLREVLQGAPEGGTPGHPKDGKWVKEQARASGIAERTLDRAAQKLGVVKHSNGFGKPRLWAMPSTPSAPSAPMCARQPGLAHMDDVGAHGAFLDPPDSVKHPSDNSFKSTEDREFGSNTPNESGEEF